MDKPGFRHFVVLAVDLIILAGGIANLFSVLERPSLPFETAATPRGVGIVRVEVPDACPKVETGDIVRSVDGYEIAHPEALQTLGDRASIGATLPVVVLRGDLLVRATVTIVPYYPTPRFAVVTFLVAALIWCLGVFLALQRPEGLAASTLQWSIILLAASLFFTQGRISSADPSWELRRGAFIVSYWLMPLGFLAFSLLHPRVKIAHAARVIRSGAVAGTILGLATAWIYVNALLDPIPDRVLEAVRAYDLMHVIQALAALGMMVSVVHSYRTLRAPAERKRLRWILMGLLVGPAPFLLLIMLPQLVVDRDLIPEEIAIACLAITPVAFAVSMLRDQVISVRTVLNRSIVYVMITVFVGIVYGLAVLLVTSSLGGASLFGRDFLVLLSLTIAVAVSLDPLRRWLQRTIDGLLYPLRRRYSDALAGVARRLHAALQPREAADIILDECMTRLPIEGIALSLAREGTNRPYAVRGIMPDAGPPAADAAVRQVDAGASPDAIPIGPVSAQVALKDASGRELRIPFRAEDGREFGAIEVALKAGVSRLTAEEDEFLLTVSTEAAEVLERLELQRRLILEHEEREKSEELNRLKSFFVSGVSHDLRTPLTAIRMFSEMIRTRRRMSARRRNEYLRIVEGETDRLTRMIDNVLDFAKIEQGVRQYQSVPVRLDEVVTKATTTMAYHFRSARGRLVVRCARRQPAIMGDADALHAMVVNLLTNALKYSAKEKKVIVTLRREGPALVLRVADQGIGIPPDEVPKIFDRFYRIRRQHERQVGGTGLGLALIKHAVEAHNGTIAVSSTVGRGSTFEIRFPIPSPPRRTEA